MQFQFIQCIKRGDFFFFFRIYGITKINGVRSHLVVPRISSEYSRHLIINQQVILFCYTRFQVPRQHPLTSPHEYSTWLWMASEKYLFLQILTSDINSDLLSLPPTSMELIYITYNIYICINKQHTHIYTLSRLKVCFQKNVFFLI